MATINITQITHEEAQGILSSAYSADNSAVYADARRAVHGNMLLARASYNASHKQGKIPSYDRTWDVSIDAPGLSNSDLVDLIPEGLRDFARVLS